MQTSRAGDVAEAAARAAGDILRRWSGRVRAREKGRADLVTEADVESQDCIEQRLCSEFPEFGFLGEESSLTHGLANRPFERPLWIVDPLDGTTNFVHGLPAFCVSIALWDQDGGVLGVIYDPSRDEMFRAERGLGGSCNGDSLRTSNCVQLDHALVAVGFTPFAGPSSPDVGQFLRLVERCPAVRRWGSAALNLAYVACGRLDAFWSSSVRAWDFAAGAVLMAEAGGRVTTPAGAPISLSDPHILASATTELSDQIRPCFNV